MDIAEQLFELADEALTRQAAQPVGQRRVASLLERYDGYHAICAPCRMARWPRAWATWPLPTPTGS
jgi:hypothetical protein